MDNQKIKKEKKNIYRICESHPKHENIYNGTDTSAFTQFTNEK